jgi:hypothetical protein
MIFCRGLRLLGYELHINNQTIEGNSKEEKESDKVRELQLLESAFQQMIMML